MDRRCDDPHAGLGKDSVTCGDHPPLQDRPGLGAAACRHEIYISWTMIIVMTRPFSHRASGLI
jgi:hypothetical protein